MKTLICQFTGLTPLLMMNIESVNRDLPMIKLGTKPNEGDIEKIAEGMTYRTEDGQLYLPSSAFRSSLLSGCTGVKFPGERRGPATIFQSLVFPAERQALLFDDKGKPIKDYEIQIDSAVNRNSSPPSRIIVVRPRIDEWYTDLPFEIDDEFAPSNYDEFLQILLKLWNRAGRIAGVGAWRPEKKGPHGKYSVVERQEKSITRRKAA